MDGRQNGWMDPGLFEPAYASKAQYLRECARYRVAAADYLTYGRLVEPLEPTNAVPQFEDDGFGWGVKHRGSVPSAEARLWQAEDGRLGIVLANYVEDSVPFEFSIDPAKYGIKGTRFQLSDLTPEGTKPLGVVAGPVRRREMLAPGTIRVIQIAASPRTAE
jgi:hypothetical protein